MGHQKIHLVCKNAAIAQDEVFPKAGHVRRIQERHMRLFGRARGLAVVAGAAGRGDVHPVVCAALRHRHDVLAREVFFV